MQFSSYPGIISSTDDFYQTTHGLVITETTEEVYNNTLYDLVKPNDCVLSWVRVVVSNTLTSSGPEWATMFSSFNSGTYNCQWYVFYHGWCASVYVCSTCLHSCCVWLWAGLLWTTINSSRALCLPQTPSP